MTKVPQDRKVPLFVTGGLIRRVFSSPSKTVSKYVSTGDVVADLGCGPGYFTIPMAELVEREGKVYAVDFDPEAIERVGVRAKENGLDEVIESRVSSAAEINFIPDESVDFVFAHGLLCCMKDHAGALGQIRRILKRDGMAYLSVARFSGRKDPRSVTAGEWAQILARFRVRESGRGLLTRWALVSKEDGRPDLQGSGAVGPACCCA